MNNSSILFWTQDYTTIYVQNNVEIVPNNLFTKQMQVMYKYIFTTKWYYENIEDFSKLKQNKNKKDPSPKLKGIN